MKMRKASLTRVLLSMALCGGWFDKETGEVFVDTGKIENGAMTRISRNKDGKECKIDRESERYLRIPILGSGAAAKAFLKENYFSPEVLASYKITKDLLDNDYPMFVERGDELYRAGRLLGNAAFKLAEDIGIEPPDATDHFFSDILKWCEERGIDIDNDYVRENYI